MARLRLVLALGAFFVLAAVWAGCGSSGSGKPTVAKIGDAEITRPDFDHWLAVAAKSGSQVPGQTVSVPDPPDFKKCIAAKIDAGAKAPKGVPKPTEASAKTQCQQQYDDLKGKAMNVLIQARWLEGEASDQKITVTDADVQKQFQQTKKQAFKTDKLFENFLKQSGMTLQDILFRVRVDLLGQKIRTKVVDSAGKVTPADVTTYYNSHKSQFGTPEQRTLRVVLTKTQAKAKEALGALRSGQDFKKVAKKFSIDPQTKATGGLLSSVVRGQQDRALDQAAFAAPKGKLLGPIKAQFGFYVFRVESIKAPTQQTEVEAAASIRQQLIAQRQQKVLSDFINKFQKKWTARTICSKGFVVAGCKGGPKTPSAAQGGSSGAPPPGAAPPPGG